MKTIWKFKLTQDVGIIPMPKGAQVLSVQWQVESVQIWALVDTAQPYIDRHFVAIGTGNMIELDTNLLKFIGTVQIPGTGLVFHFFEML